MSSYFHVTLAFPILYLAIMINVVFASESTSILSAFASRTYGPGNEACTTTGIALRPTDNWLDRLKNAKPGDTFLLRAGTYNLTTTLALPNGDAGNSISIKPFNCETAIIFGASSTQGVGTAILPGRYNIISGLRIESATHEKLIEITENVRDVEFRNNTLYGGRNDAIRIIGGVANVLFSGNDINSGPGQLPGVTRSSGGHVFVIRNNGKDVPNKVRIVRNRIRGSYFGDLTKGDDTIAVSGGNDVTIEQNDFTENYNIEEVIDIKSRFSRVRVVIRENVFHNNFLGTHGGQDGGRKLEVNPEITIGDHDTPPALLQHLIESNYFERGISVGPGRRSGSALIRNNIVHASATNNPSIIFNRAFNTIVINNTYYRGGFKIGRSRGCIPKAELTFKNNIFFETFVKDQTDRCSSSPYTLANNILYSLRSRFERGVQVSNIGAEPLFIDPHEGDFRLKVNSHARVAGEQGTTIGAVITPTLTSR